jgi:hypothetical protein
MGDQPMTDEKPLDPLSAYRIFFTPEGMPNLDDDEIKKYGMEVLSSASFKGLDNAQRTSLFALVGFCHCIAAAARKAGER